MRPDRRRRTPPRPTATQRAPRTPAHEPYAGGCSARSATGSALRSASPPRCSCCATSVSTGSRTTRPSSRCSASSAASPTRDSRRSAHASSHCASPEPSASVCSARFSASAWSSHPLAWRSPLLRLAVGYSQTLVLGTLVAGIGVVAVAAQSTLLMPLPVELKFGRVTAIDVLRQALTLAGVAILVAAGAGLFAMLAVQAPVAIARCSSRSRSRGIAAAVWPRLERRLASMLFREALPIAISLTLGVIYLRVLVILCGFLTTTTQTGYFGTSFRAFEVLVEPADADAVGCASRALGGGARRSGSPRRRDPDDDGGGAHRRPVHRDRSGSRGAAAADRARRRSSTRRSPRVEDPDLRDRAGLRGPGLATRSRRGAPAARPRDRERRGPRGRPRSEA